MTMKRRTMSKETSVMSGIKLLAYDIDLLLYLSQTIKSEIIIGKLNKNPAPTV